jgi:Carbon-nitrogen hydrolase
VNRVGRDIGGSPARFYGASVFVSPNGEVVTQASETHEQVLYAEVDTAISAKLRDEWGFLQRSPPRDLRCAHEALGRTAVGRSLYRQGQPHPAQHAGVLTGSHGDVPAVFQLLWRRLAPLDVLDTMVGS